MCNDHLPAVQPTHCISICQNVQYFTGSKNCVLNFTTVCWISKYHIPFVILCVTVLCQYYVGSGIVLHSEIIRQMLLTDSSVAVVSKILQEWQLQSCLLFFVVYNRCWTISSCLQVKNVLLNWKKFAHGQKAIRIFLWNIAVNQDIVVLWPVL